jgi:hypothetical protein
MQLSKCGDSEHGSMLPMTRLSNELTAQAGIGPPFCHYFTFGINLANSGSGMNPPRFGISILGRLCSSSSASAGTMPFKFKI